MPSFKQIITYKNKKHLNNDHTEGEKNRTHILIAWNRRGNLLREAPSISMWPIGYTSSLREYSSSAHSILLSIWWWRGETLPLNCRTPTFHGATWLIRPSLSSSWLGPSTTPFAGDVPAVHLWWPPLSVCAGMISPVEWVEFSNVGTFKRGWWDTRGECGLISVIVIGKGRGVGWGRKIFEAFHRIVIIWGRWVGGVYWWSLYGEIWCVGIV